MKILYDISVLGQGFVNPKAKTGVYRVVKSLFFELLKRQDIELTAIALNGISSIWDYASTLLYLKTEAPDLLNRFESCYFSQLKLMGLYQQGVKLQRQLLNISQTPKTRFLYLPALALQVPFKTLGKQDIKIHVDSDQYHVYHSPFYAIPHPYLSSKTSKMIMIHDLIPILYPQNFTKTIYSKFISSIQSINLSQDWVVCNSTCTKEDLCQYTGINPKRVFVTLLAAGEHFYPVKNLEIIANTLTRYNIPNVPYLLSLCTLEPRKNLNFLIKCFAKIITENPTLDINLVLVGVSGWKNKAIFIEAQSNPLLKSRIIFTGYIPDEDLSAIYSGALAFVYPSLYEGFGLPPLEAMQCATPVITSNTSSLPEVVGDAGIMINPKDEDDLCNALLNLINDEQLRQKLSEKGLQRSRQFSWAKCAEETVKVYQIAKDSI